MLGTRLSSYIVGFVLIISCLYAEGQRPKCAQFNEYCQTHSDCCSNTCLTYLYRCDHNYNGIYPYTFFGEKIPVETTVDQVIALTFAGSAPEPQYQGAQQNVANRANFGQQITYRKYKRQATQTIEGQQTSSDDNVAAASNQPSDSAADCKAIGLKCFNNDECCSKRCHGFLHQCVT